MAVLRHAPASATLKPWASGRQARVSAIRPMAAATPGWVSGSRVAISSWARSAGIGPCSRIRP